MSYKTKSIGALLKAHKEAEAAAQAAKPQRLVPLERARLIRSLNSQLRNARVNSKVYLEVNAQLNKIYMEEMALDEAFALEHAE